MQTHSLLGGSEVFNALYSPNGNGFVIAVSVQALISSLLDSNRISYARVFSITKVNHKIVKWTCILSFNVCVCVRKRKKNAFIYWRKHTKCTIWKRTTTTTTKDEKNNKIRCIFSMWFSKFVLHKSGRNCYLMPYSMPFLSPSTI